MDNITENAVNLGRFPGDGVGYALAQLAVAFPYRIANALLCLPGQIILHAAHRMVHDSSNLVGSGIVDRPVYYIVLNVHHRQLGHMIASFAYEPHGLAQLITAIYRRQYRCAGEHPQTNPLHTAELAVEFFLAGNSAANVAGNRIMEDATEKAKEMLLERFDGKLDGLMSDYQRNLDNVGKIYQSIASSMADKAGKNVTMTLG